MKSISNNNKNGNEPLKTSIKDVQVKNVQRFITSLVKKDPDIMITILWAELVEWNEAMCKPPLNEKELKNIFNSIADRELDSIRKTESNPKKTSGGDKLLDIIEQEDRITLFHDEYGKTYVQLPVLDHEEVWPCRSKAFKQWLCKQFWETHKKALNSEALNNALNIIRAKAYFDGDEIKLSNRVAKQDNTLWYDLADSRWQAIKITSQGWCIVKNPPIIFKRYVHQKSQVEPAQNGNVREFLEFINVSNKQTELLILVWLVSCFIPDFPHAMPIIFGAQGSAKSMLCKFSRKIIDPSSIEVVSFPSSMKELVQLLSHHYYIPFDNVSNLSEWISDELCKAVTGSGFSKRELYSDDEDVIYWLQKCIAINGISLVATKSDMLERALIVELERIPKLKRKSENKLLAEFAEKRAKILGGIFDTIVNALKIYPTVDIKKTPRMADFTIWGCAIAEALGYTRKEFLDAYFSNLEVQNKEVLYENLVAATLLSFMDGKSDWNGTPTELLEELQNSDENQKIVNQKGFPKAANILSRRINELRTNLAEAGMMENNALLT